MTKKKPEKLADQRYTDARGKSHKRWTARKRWASVAPGGFALFDGERKEFPKRATTPYYDPFMSNTVNWSYWKSGTRAQVEAYIKRTRAETFMRQRVEAKLDRGRAA
jgi:hypothetical protein